MSCKAAAAVSQAKHSSAATKPLNSQWNGQTMVHSKQDRQGIPAFSGDVACAVATLVTFQAPEMGILPGLALLLGMPCLIHNASIICGDEEAWRIQQVAPLQGQQATDTRHPPLVQRPACVPVRWHKLMVCSGRNSRTRDSKRYVLC